MCTLFTRNPCTPPFEIREAGAINVRFGPALADKLWSVQTGAAEVVDVGASVQQVLHHVLVAAAGCAGNISAPTALLTPRLRGPGRIIY